MRAHPRDKPGFSTSGGDDLAIGLPQCRRVSTVSRQRPWPRTCRCRLPLIVLSVWGEAVDERTAIVEHDGKVPPAWAEGFARLDPDRPPGDVPPKRWLRFIDDVGAFLDNPFYISIFAFVLRS